MENKFMVGSSGQGVRVLLPVNGRSLSREEAINLAVWLVVNAEVAGISEGGDAKSEFDAAYTAAMNT